MTDLAYMTIAEASRLIRARKLSPVELTEALLARIAALDGIYHAYIAVTADAARAEAKAAEAEIAGGTWRGPMHGIPYAAKDIFDVAGMATTCHSKLRMDHRAAADATVITRLRTAGAILLGKLALHEFATGGPTRELPWPAALNPWNLDLHPGGSSSGSAVAVATGLAPGTLGTDTGGSVRNPATCCGVIGMKPTYGLVSRVGVFPLSFSLDHVGPLTRTVEDNAILLGAIAGHDPTDPASADRQQRCASATASSVLAQGLVASPAEAVLASRHRRRRQLSNAAITDSFGHRARGCPVPTAAIVFRPVALSGRWPAAGVPHLATIVVCHISVRVP